MVDRRREFLAREGFAVLRGFFSKEEIAALRVDQDRFYAGECEGEPEFSWPRPRACKGRSRKHPYASFFIPSLGKLLRDGRLANLVRSLTEMRGLRFWHDQLLYEEPARRPDKDAQWHVERSRWLTCGTGMMATAWIPLLDFTPEMGPITMVPGSHHAGEIVLPEGWEPSAGAERRMALEAGDVLVFPWGMIHGNPPNLAQVARRAVAAHFCEKEIRYVEKGRFSHVNERLVRRVGGAPDFTDGRVCPLLLA